MVDANVLIYAVNKSDKKHKKANHWLDHALSGNADVGFPWMAILAFLRLSTKPNIFPRPLTLITAHDIVNNWLAQPSAMVINPTDRHLKISFDLLQELGSAGNLINDAHLAALAIEYNATVITFDTDFGRFKNVAWQVPE